MPGSGHKPRTSPPLRFVPAALALCALVFLSACKVPEQRQAFYPNGVLKERYWVYRDGGREVMHGLYTGFFPNGEPQVEILYRDGSEATKTYFSEQGAVVGTVDLASLRDP
jgi:antitoxin component YwqK of YwqJK toxin-antitoxin module